MEVVLSHIKTDAWSGFKKYPGCFTGIGSIWTRSGNRYTGLTEEDARRLEKAIGYPEGHLSPQSKFWTTYAVRVDDKPVIMHTEQPEDELKYLFCKGHKRVANGTANIRPSHDFVLVNKEVEAEVANKNNKVKREAFAEFNKMSTNDRKKALRLYGYKSDNVSDDVIESKLFDFIENDPTRFMNLWVNNLGRETQYIIEGAIAKNIMRKQKNLYYYGTEVVGRSMDEAIMFLDDKMNQDIRIAIMQELESK